MNLNKKTLVLIIIFISTNSYSGINDKQKKVIESQLFLLNEGMISKKDVFEKTKLFDNKGFFGINSDVMTQEEFDNFLEARRTHH
mgnify:FL=1|tara:strand:- start:121 stop:375 length:255 start_codon:yes stop_codon:yes gene_type:complete